MNNRLIRALLLAAILLLPLAVSAQPKSGGLKIPPKKTTTTKPAPSTKTSSKKSSTKSGGTSTKQSKKTSQSSQQSLYSQPVLRQIPRVIQNLIANMVYVEGGTFTMGATSEQGSDAYYDEKPAHQVTLSSFCISKYEVTQAEWQAVMGSNPSHFTGDSQRPVEQVSWNNCQVFIRKLNMMTGKHFRLPTEAEWEYAARGGNRSRGYKYAGSNTLGEVAWYYDNSGSTTHPVGTKSPNELGLYDMSGNVWEWCQDRYSSYSSSTQHNPTGSTFGSERVNRGGSWFLRTLFCRVSGRFSGKSGDRNNNLGLRLAL